MSKKSVLVIGLEPSLIDFSDPAYGAYPGMDASKVMASLKADEANLNALGYDAQLCLTDFGETAEAVVQARLSGEAIRLRPYRRRCSFDRPEHTLVREADQRGA